MSSHAIALLSALLSAALTLVVIKVAHRRGWLVFPRSDRWSARPVAQFGGTAILLGFLLASLLLPLSQRAVKLILLTAAMGAFGLWDDVRCLPPRIKFLSQVILAIAAVYCGFVYPLRTAPAINFLFTIVWIVGITNAFNLLDNMDGLAAGVGILTAISILLVQAPAVSSRGLILAMAGSLLGYLVFNFPPAKIFMGDAGSLAIGFFLACSFAGSAQHLSTLLSVLFTPVLVLFLPIFDTVLVSVTRRLNGRAISAGAKDHSSHRLVMLGMTERNAVLTLYSVCGLSGLAALLLKKAQPDEAPALLSLFLVVGTLFWLYLAGIELPEDWHSRTNVFTLVLPEFLNSVAKRIAAVLLDMVLLLISVYLAFLPRFSGMMRSVLPALLLAGVLALVIKTPLLALFSAYRGDWQLGSLREAYPILKASICGSLVMITLLVYLTRVENFSRTMFVLDFVFSLMLLTAVRLAPRLFQDLLPKQSAAGFLLVGGPSARFFVHYFEWKPPRTQVCAVADGGGIQKMSLLGIPVVSMAEVANLFEKAEVAGVYVLPDCREAERDCISQLCASHGIPIRVFHLNIEVIAGGGPRIESRQAANAAQLLAG